MIHTPTQWAAHGQVTYVARPSRAKGCLTWLSDDQWLWPRWPRQCWCQLVSSRLGSRKNPRSFQPNMSAIVSCQVKICEVAPMFNIFGRLWKPQHDFSRMRSKGSRFTLGVWGLRVCSLDVAFTVATVRNRSQPSATVRNRSRVCYMAVPMVSSAEVVIFGGFRRLVASFRVAGVALRDIQRCFVTCRKLFCVAGAILLRRFQKMCCSFRGRCSTLDVSIVILRGRRSTLDVSCCVFFANRIGRAALKGDKVQIPWQAWHLVTCAEN